MIGQPDTTPISKELAYATEKARENLGLIELENQRLDKLNRSLNKTNVDLSAHIEYLNTTVNGLNQTLEGLEIEIKTKETTKSNLDKENSEILKRNKEIEQHIETQNTLLNGRREELEQSEKNLLEERKLFLIEHESYTKDKQAFETTKEALRDILNKI